eukprot:GFKZ01010681.1.p1 GENE.GFKZ01010681.1~~GFKZ01010681.1.p1  ORF type:complete len:412 (+),score=66.90 GFKZ01010681.1:116-1237(+)
MPPSTALLHELLPPTPVPTLAPLLSLFDVTAGRCAAVFSAGPVVTACLDDLSLFQPPQPSDLLTSTAQILTTGRSSLLIRVLIHRTPTPSSRNPSPTPQLCLAALATFVAIEKAGDTTRPVPHTPPPPDPLFTPAQSPLTPQALFSRLKFTRSILSEDNTRTLATIADRTSPYAPLLHQDFFQRIVHPGRTVVRFRKQFLPHNLNMNGVIFGGDILALMEDVALLSARRVSPTSLDLRVVGIRGLSFLQPVPLKVVLEVEAKTVVASEAFVGVVVRTWLDENHDGTDMVKAHEGVFHIFKGVHGGLGVEMEMKEGMEDTYRVLGLPLNIEVKRRWAVEARSDAYPVGGELAYGEEHHGVVRAGEGEREMLNGS